MVFPIAALSLADEPIQAGIDHLPLKGIDKHALNHALLQLTTDHYLVIMPKVFYLRRAPFQKIRATCFAIMGLLFFMRDLFGQISDT